MCLFNTISNFHKSQKNSLRNICIPFIWIQQLVFFSICFIVCSDFLFFNLWKQLADIMTLSPYIL